MLPEPLGTSTPAGSPPTLTLAPSHLLLAIALATALCVCGAAAAGKRRPRCSDNVQCLNYNDRKGHAFMLAVIQDCLRRKLPLPPGFGLPFRLEARWWKPGPYVWGRGKEGGGET